MMPCPHLQLLTSPRWLECARFTRLEFSRLTWLKDFTTEDEKNAGWYGIWVRSSG